MMVSAQGYVVLNRPFAILQWVRGHLVALPEAYVLMLEPDHFFLQPPPLWRALCISNWGF